MALLARILLHARSMFSAWIQVVRRCGCMGLAFGFALAISLFSLHASARVGSDAGLGCGAGKVCSLDEPVDADGPISATDASTPVDLLFFWGTGCPHCEEAKPLIDALAKEHLRLRVESIEARTDPNGRRRFIDTMKRLGATAVGVPTFVVGNAYVVGYTKGETDKELRAIVAKALGLHGADAGAESRGGPPSVALTFPDDEAERVVIVPWIGEVDATTVSLPGLTVAMGLVDGVNPCAIWVLVVLLGILLHVETTRQMLLYAGSFVIMSGVVYFLFMSAWATLFALVGLSRVATIILGAALLGMGLLNLKDVVWFKKGPSLVIPDKVKPRLFRRMRNNAAAATTPAALGGIAALAFVVNLVELGCTLGLPAVYTRILSLRGLAATSRFAYLALYNTAYVIPLIIVVVAFIVLKRRLIMTERIARTLKGVSGVLLVTFGVLFLAAPQVLSGE